MYQAVYADTQEGSSSDARAREFQVLDRAAAKLAHAGRPDASEGDRAAALNYACDIWTIFLDDLGHSENELPIPLRAGLISVGLWVHREIDAIRTGTSVNYAGLADICIIIRDGLETASRANPSA